jgi:hypothetical protein
LMGQMQSSRSHQLCSLKLGSYLSLLPSLISTIQLSKYSLWQSSIGHRSIFHQSHPMRWSVCILIFRLMCSYLPFLIQMAAILSWKSMTLCSWLRRLSQINRESRSPPRLQRGGHSHSLGQTLWSWKCFLWHANHDHCDKRLPSFQV